MSTIETNRSWTHFRVHRRNPRYCHVTFDHPPINTITATTVAELSDLAGLIEQDPDLNVVVFDSANRDFYLAHYDLENDPGRTEALGVGPTGQSAWIDVLVRPSGSCSPVVCGSPLARTRFSASGKLASVVPGGGPMARLSRLVGRGRALEILLVADDLDGPRAEQYGYVNRLIADDQLDAEVEAIASRLARFDHDAIARTKSYVDQVTLPDNSELGPPWNDFLELFRRPAQQAQSARLRELGLNTDGEFERSLGRRLVESFPDA